MIMVKLYIICIIGGAISNLLGIIVGYYICYKEYKNND